MKTWMALNREKFKEIVFSSVLIAIGTTAIVLFLIRIGNLNLIFAFLITLTYLTLLVLDFKKCILFIFIFSFFGPFLGRIADYVDYLHGAQIGGSYWFAEDALATTTSILFIFALLFFFMGRTTLKKRIIEHPLDKFIFLYLGFSFLQIFNPNQQSLVVGIYGFKNVLFPFIMYFLIREFKPKKGSKIVLKMLKIIIVYGIIASLYGILQYFFWEDIPFESFFLQNPPGVYFQGGIRVSELRVFSLSGGDMGFFFPLVAFTIVLFNIDSHCLKTNWIRLKKLFFIIFLSLLAISLIRTAIAMLVIGILSTKTFTKRVSISLRRGILITLVVIAGLHTFNFIAPKLKTRSGPKLVRFAELANPFGAPTFVDRRKVEWPTAWQAIRTHPMGTGMGSGRLTRAARRLNFRYIMPHNDFLLRFLEQGIIGGFLFILLLIEVAKYSILIIKKSNNSLNRRLNQALLGVFVAFVFCGMVNIPFDSQSGMVFWLLVGLSLGSGEIRDIKNKKEQE